MADNHPKKIGDYHVIAKLGQGGMARVWLTLRPGPAGVNKLLVVKELREELVNEPAFLSMFLDEARLAARLNHRNVVHTYEIVTEDDRYYIAMDYLEGQPLSRLIRRVGYEDIPIELLVYVFIETLSGLQYAHTLRDLEGHDLAVVHRDVSPQNVFVSYDGQVHVVDFGIAKAKNSSSQTAAGMLKGKVRYMAPEQARGSTVDGRSDVFAVGVMLWEVLAQRKISDDSSDVRALYRRIEGTEPDIAELAPGAPPALVAICKRAMALQAEDRYADADEMANAFEQFLEDSGKAGGRKKLSKLVEGAFGKERKRIARLIDEQIKRLNDPEAASVKSLPRLTSPTLPSVDPDELLIINPETAEATTPAGSGRTLSTTSPSALAASTNNRMMFFGLGSLLIGVVGYVALGGGTAGEGAEGTQPASTSQVAASVASAAPVAAASSSASVAPPEVAAAAQISLDLRVEPRGAMLTLDGKELSDNPHRVQVPVDKVAHRLVASLEGYESEEKSLDFAKDVKLVIKLKRSRRTRGRRRAKAAKAVTPSASPPRPVAPPKTTSTARVINEDNPY